MAGNTASLAAGARDAFDFGPLAFNVVLPKLTQVWSIILARREHTFISMFRVPIRSIDQK